MSTRVVCSEREKEVVDDESGLESLVWDITSQVRYYTGAEWARYEKGQLISKGHFLFLRCLFLAGE